MFRFIFSKETNDLVLSYDNSKLLVDRSLLLLSGINPYDGILEIPKSKFRVGEYYEIRFININSTDGVIEVLN